MKVFCYSNNLPHTTPGMRYRSEPNIRIEVATPKRRAAHARRYVLFWSLWDKLLNMNFEAITMNTKLSKLPIDERIKLVEALWDSIASDQMALPLTDEQKAELDRRLDAYEADGNRGRLATESIKEIRRKL